MDVLSLHARRGGEVATLAADREGTVRALPWARELSDRHVALLASVSEPHWFDRGAELVREGQAMQHAHIVVSGKVEILRGGEVLATVGDGGVLTLLVALSADGRGAHARALVPTTTLAMSIPHLLEVLEESAAVMREGVSSFAASLLTLRQRVGPSVEPPPGPDARRLARATPDLALGDRMVLLARAFEFARGNVECIGDLAKIARHVVIEDGAALWSADATKADTIWVIQSGRVVGYERGGVASHGPGQVVGMLEALAGQPRWFDARADGVVTLLSFRVSDLLEVLHGHFEMMRPLVTSIGTKALQVFDEKPRVGD